MYGSHSPKTPAWTHSGNVCQWIDWRIHPRATRLRLNVDEWGAWGIIPKDRKNPASLHCQTERMIMNHVIRFCCVARLGIQPSWIAATPTPWSSKWARLRRSTQAKNEPRNDEGNLEGGSRRCCYYVMFWQVLQFFQSFFWNDYHDISTVYWYWYPLISVYPGFYRVWKPPLWSLQNQKIWKSHPRWQTQGLSPCCWKLSGGWPWCFLHLTSIRTSIRVHPFFQQSIFQVLNPVKPGVARFNYCNFWYVPWDTLCTAPAGAFLKRWRRMESWQGFLLIPVRHGDHSCEQGMECDDGWELLEHHHEVSRMNQRRLGWKDQSEMPWFKCVFLSENTYYRSTLFNSYMKWSCKRQLWIEMARVVLHSAICWGKASQHSDSSLTRNPNSRSHILAFFKTQKLPLVPFSNWKFLWVGFAAPHFAGGSWYRQKHVCSFRTPSASRNSRPFFPSTNIGPSKDGKNRSSPDVEGRSEKITRGGSETKKPMKYTLFWEILRVEKMQWWKKSGCW